MSEGIVNMLIWWAGAIFWIAIFACVTAALSVVMAWCGNEMARRLMRFVRMATAYYWVQRMEDEGLTVMQTEYRRMVAERKPHSRHEFADVDLMEENRRYEENKARWQALQTNTAPKGAVQGGPDTVQ